MGKVQDLVFVSHHYKNQKKKKDGIAMPMVTFMEKKITMHSVHFKLPPSILIFLFFEIIPPSILVD